MDRAAAIDKILKMLATANSIPNTPEGKTARALALRKMQEHGITEADLAAAKVAESVDTTRPAGDLSEYEEALFEACCLYVRGRGGGVASAFFDVVVGRIDEEIERECIRSRALYLGKLGRDFSTAERLGRVHMERYADAFIPGLLEACIARLSGRNLPLDVLLKRVGMVQAPIEITSWYRSRREQVGPNDYRQWTRYHVQNGWEAGNKIADTLELPPLPPAAMLAPPAPTAIPVRK
jgi:hypothetical protein